jgi:hypothetical protein
VTSVPGWPSAPCAPSTSSSASAPIRALSTGRRREGLRLRAGQDRVPARGARHCAARPGRGTGTGYDAPVRGLVSGWTIRSAVCRLRAAGTACSRTLLLRRCPSTQATTGCCSLCRARITTRGQGRATARSRDTEPTSFPRKVRSPGGRQPAARHREIPGAGPSAGNPAPMRGSMDCPGGRSCGRDRRPRRESLRCCGPARCSRRPSPGPRHG